MADETELMLDDDDALPVEEAPDTAPDSKQSLDDIISKAIETDDDATADGRARDEHGRFIAKTESDTAEAPEGPSDAAPVESAEPPQPENAQAAAPALTDGHFRGWTPEQREQFQKLAPEAQTVAYEVIQQRDKFYQDRFSEYQQTADPLIASVRPHFDRIQASGLDVGAYVSNVMSADHALTYGTYEQKQQLITQLAQMAGVPIQIAQPDEWSDPLQPGGQAYPVVHDLRTQLAQQQQELQRFRSMIEQQHEAQTTSQLTAFAASTNPDGTPKYPFFNEVRASMGQLMASGRAATLEDAYKVAAQPLEARFTAEIEKRTRAAEDARKAAIEKARKAKPLRVSATGANGKVVSKGIDAHLQAALSALPD